MVLCKLTILCFPASLIHRMLSLYCCLMRSFTLALTCSKTLAAMLSVAARSWGSPDVHTQRKGPKPKEKISLRQWQKEKNHKPVTSIDWWIDNPSQCLKKQNNVRWCAEEIASPHNVLDIRWVTKFSRSSTHLFYLCTFKNITKSSFKVWCGLNCDNHIERVL